MKTITFEVPLYKVDVTLVQIERKEDLDSVISLFEDNGITETATVEDYIKRELHDGGDTWRNLEKRVMIVVFYPFSSPESRANIYEHEKRHLEDRILNYFGVEDIESAAILAGYLGEQFYHFTYDTNSDQLYWKPYDVMYE